MNDEEHLKLLEQNLLKAHKIERERTKSLQKMVEDMYNAQKLTDEQVWIGTVDSWLQGGQPICMPDLFTLSDNVLAAFKQRFRQQDNGMRQEEK
jgi:hypothetical protein